MLSVLKIVGLNLGASLTAFSAAPYSMSFYISKTCKSLFQSHEMAKHDIVRDNKNLLNIKVNILI